MQSETNYIDPLKLREAMCKDTSVTGAVQVTAHSNEMWVITYYLEANNRGTRIESVIFEGGFTFIFKLVLPTSEGNLSLINSIEKSFKTKIKDFVRGNNLKALPTQKDI